MMKKKMKHTQTHEDENTSGKIVKKIRSSISRPHRTQFPLVHINIHTHNRHVSPRSHLYDYLTHTHTRRHSFRHARMDVAMETFCVVKQMEKRGSQAPQQPQPTTTENQRRRDRLRLNQHIRTQPTTRRRRTHTHNSHDHTHTHTSSLTYASCAFSEQLIVIEEKSRVRVSF